MPSLVNTFVSCSELETLEAMIFLERLHHEQNDNLLIYDLFLHRK